MYAGDRGVQRDFQETVTAQIYHKAGEPDFPEEEIGYVWCGKQHLGEERHTRAVTTTGRNM